MKFDSIMMSGASILGQSPDEGRSPTLDLSRNGGAQPPPHTRRHSRLTSLLSFAILVVLIIASAFDALAQRRRQTTLPRASNKSITVRTEPGAIVWLDEVRRGVTDSNGALELKVVLPGRHTLRVRANGFRETSVALAAARRGTVAVRLVRTTDQAEILFQQAESAREKARDETALKLAAELYRSVIKLRPKFAAAHLGLARVLLELHDYNTALEEIDAAFAARPNYPEASAVEGRILRASADEGAAIEAFKRAITEARGFQPEAHTGLALVYQDKGQYDEAAAEFIKALGQLSDTEPLLYQLLGAIYEKQEKYKEAVVAYEKYLELAPEGSLAPAIRSVMDQLRQQAEGRSGLPY